VIGLGAEKFLLDGRHVGTGGGNHVVMGGATAADSPFLRRPDLLKSLLGFWHNHPSLSFCSPACSSARPASIRASTRRATTPLRAGDRLPPGRARTPDPAVAGRPHLPQHPADDDRQHAPHRVLHRQALTPDSATGRRGLLELRAFEMPPHAR
jgi:uncharacterized protein (DUF2126 family)